MRQQSKQLQLDLRTSSYSSTIYLDSTTAVHVVSVLRHSTQLTPSTVQCSCGHSRASRDVATAAPAGSSFRSFATALSSTQADRCSRSRQALRSFRSFRAFVGRGQLGTRMGGRDGRKVDGSSIPQVRKAFVSLRLQLRLQRSCRRPGFKPET